MFPVAQVNVGDFFISSYDKMASDQDKEASSMFIPKGYFTSDGYIGFLPDGGRLYFPTYDEYIEYIEEAAA